MQNPLSVLDCKRLHPPLSIVAEATESVGPLQDFPVAEPGPSSVLGFVRWVNLIEITSFLSSFVIPLCLRRASEACLICISASLSSALLPTEFWWATRRRGASGQ